MALLGPPALFAFAAVAHLALILFTLYRMTRRRGAEPVTPYRYMPRTSMILARLLGRSNGERRNAAAPAGETERREP